MMMRQETIGPKAFKLDTLNVGCDEILNGESKREVLADVLSHHEVDELPEGWTLDEIELTAEVAEQLAPWAAKIVECDGGYMAFESITDYETWAAQV
jgi:hypothetical protein